MPNIVPPCGKGLIMEKLSKFYPVLVSLLAIGLINAGAGIAFADIVSYYLYSKPVYEPPQKMLSGKPVKVEKEKVHTGDLLSVLKRNMFCSTCEPISLDDINKSGKPGEATAVVDSLENAALLTTMVADNPKYSLAAISVEKPEEKTLLVGIDDDVSGAKVTLIEDKKVTFIKDGKEKVLFLLKTAPAPIAKPVPGAVSSPEDDLASKIKNIGPNKYEVERSVILEFMKNMAGGVKGARVMPDPNGGFRAAFVRSNSIFYKLGLRSGDVIKSVNNIQLDSFDKALLMYTQMKNANHITVSVNRRGKTENIDFSIR